MAYADAYALQRRLQAEVIAGRETGDDTMHLLLVEHDPPVITVSRRRGARDHLVASEEQLAAGLAERLEAMLAEGTTTVEVKSGYGLTTADELKMLRAIRSAGERSELTVVPTACLAHAIAGEPADVVEIVASYADWLKGSAGLPKLFINAEPGAILTGEVRELCRSWPDQQEVTVKGSHFVQEDSPDEIGRAVADWLRGLG